MERDGKDGRLCYRMGGVYAMKKMPEIWFLKGKPILMGNNSASHGKYGLQKLSLLLGSVNL